MIQALLELFGGIFAFAGHITGGSSFPEPLSPEEEKDCIARLEAGDAEARRLLIEHNLRLVAHIAKKYTTPKRDADDVISIGVVGLIKAVSTFNSQKGNTLATYAARCIENAILSQQKKRRLRWRNGCLLRQNGACWREWESAAIFCFPMYRVR